MSRRPLGTALGRTAPWVALGAVLAMLLLALALPGGLSAALRLLIALPLVLVLPGYAVTAAVFPRRRLGAPETIAFSLGLSLAVLVLAGLALSLTPWGMGTVPWGIFLGVMALAAAGGWRRQHGMSGVGGTIPLPAARTALPFAAAALIVLAALRLAIVGQAQQPQAGFTQLWILPAPASAGNAGAIRVGIATKEPAPTRYIVRLSAGGRTLRVWPDVAIAPGRGWQATFPLPAGLPAGGRVEATLSRATTPLTIYRRVWIERDT